MPISGKSKHLNTSIGIAVVSIIAALFVIAVLFSSGVTLESYTTYQINMTESVSGLTPDATVEYNGVDVGSVSAIEINKANPNIVQLLLSITSDTLITKDTVAMLKPKGLTGLNYISLSLRGNNLTPLTAKPGQPYPIIPSTPSYFMQLDAMVSHLDDIFGDMKASFQALLNKDDLETLRETYYSVDHIIDALKGTSGTWSIIGINTKIAISNFKKMRFYKDEISSSVEIQLAPMLYRLLDQFSVIASTLAEAAKTLKDHPTLILSGAIAPELGPGESASNARPGKCKGEHKI